jgi:(p)ppGpp synthase/HD superfamily hydrolase
MPTLEDAIQLAVQAHKGKTDRYGAPIILHVLRVMLRLESDIEKTVGVLHDVVEKTTVTLESLRAAGYSEEILAALDCVTRREGESYESFVARTASNPLAVRVKLADLEDNMDLRRAEKVSAEDAERHDRHVRAWRKLRGGKE